MQDYDFKLSKYLEGELYTCWRIQEIGASKRRNNNFLRRMDWAAENW
jgi:hypothetical protein